MDNIKVSVSILLPGSSDSKPAKQVINMSEQAYDYMVGKVKPAQYKGEVGWGNMTVNQRVKYHAMQIADSLGGQLDSFEVLQ